MLKKSASAFMRLGERFHAAEIIFAFDEELDEEERGELRTVIVGMINVCKDMGMPVSLELLEKRRDDLPETDRELRHLLDAVYAELSNQCIVFIPAHRAKFYEKSDILTEPARAAFPKANVELVTAGNAFAAGLSTACVFHCMRSLEYGIVALAGDVGAKLDGTENWKNALDKIDSQIKALADGPRQKDKPARLQFLNEAAGEFRHFKDGWRNYVSHNKVEYDESQALKTLEHVLSFTELISVQLSESA